MDEELQRLERQVQKNPGDHEAKRAYEAALKRADRRDLLRRLYRLDFECPLQWTELESTADVRVRRCGSCDRDVHLVTRPEEFLEHVETGACVALFPGRVDASLDRLAEEPGSQVDRARESCLLPIAWQQVILGECQHNESRSIVGRPPSRLDPELEQALYEESGGESPMDLAFGAEEYRLKQLRAKGVDV